jgi:Protein of unknown function (DUF3016)
MKTSGLLLLSVTLSIMTALTNLCGAEAADVTIQYVHPERFTDFSIHGRDYRWSASYFTSQIGQDLGARLKRRFPGSKLTLRFTDIDLAGARASRRGRDVRVVRGEIEPARMSFDFLLQDSTGRTLANGSTRLTDTSSRSLHSRPSSSQSLYYEKRMLERWLRSLKVA